MRIPKTLFLNLIRCKRFAALNELKQNKTKAIIDDSSLDELFTQDREMKLEEAKMDMLKEIYETDNEDEIDFEQLKIGKQEELAFMDDFNLVEELAAKKVLNLFGGKVIYGQSFKEQKYIEHTIDGYKFYAFMDIFQEDDKTIRIIECKASTDSRFYKIAPKIPYFEKSSEGILYSYDDRQVLGTNNEFKLSSQKEALISPFHDNGRSIYDLAFQRYIYERSSIYNPKNKKVEYYLGVLNSKYIFDGKTQNGKPCFDPNEIITLVYATNFTNLICKSRLDNDISAAISSLNECDINKVPIGKNCLRKKTRECIYFGLCLKDNKINPVENLFNFYHYHYGFKVSGQAKKDDFYECLNNDELKDIKNMKEEYLSGERQKTQLKVILAPSLNDYYLDRTRLKEWLNKNLVYPLYHLDFESLPKPLPRFKDEKCYTQSLFQFSLHIEKEPGVCDKDDNIAFLAINDKEDQRYDLAKKLCDSIGPTGSVVVYNQTFEKQRLKELASYFPELSEKLNNINDRIIDLYLGLIPSKEVSNTSDTVYYFYHRKLYGSFSIKKVLPIFAPELSYKELNVQNGVMAYTSFLQLGKLADKNAREGLRKDMLEYCKLDTYSMFVILKKLRGIIYNNENL